MRSTSLRIVSTVNSRKPRRLDHNMRFAGVWSKTNVKITLKCGMYPFRLRRRAMYYNVRCTFFACLRVDNPEARPRVTFRPVQNQRVFSDNIVHGVTRRKRSTRAMPRRHKVIYHIARTRSHPRRGTLYCSGTFKTRPFFIPANDFRSCATPNSGDTRRIVRWRCVRRRKQSRPTVD